MKLRAPPCSDDPTPLPTRQPARPTVADEARQNPGLLPRKRPVKHLAGAGGTTYTEGPHAQDPRASRNRPAILRRRLSSQLPQDRGAGGGRIDAAAIALTGGAGGYWAFQQIRYPDLSGRRAAAS